MAPPSKKRKTESKVEEVTFDLDARQDYLTGFHKRKLQRAKFAQEKATERARLERIEQRKKLREERKADLERHVKAVNDLLKPADKPLDKDSDDEDQYEDEGEGWGGIEDVAPEPVDHEAEYIDEDKYTTVIVEEMDVTREGLMKAEQGEDNDSASEKSLEPNGALTGESVDLVSKPEKKTGKRPWSKDKPKDTDKLRKPRKKRNFRYEGKLERKASRVKQKRKNSEQAKARKTN